jgi:hypothetical protein
MTFVSLVSVCNNCSRLILLLCALLLSRPLCMLGLMFWYVLESDVHPISVKPLLYPFSLKEPFYASVQGRLKPWLVDL